jgi:hypothetical protein
VDWLAPRAWEGWRLLLDAFATDERAAAREWVLQIALRDYLLTAFSTKVEPLRIIRWSFASSVCCPS